MARPSLKWPYKFWGKVYRMGFLIGEWIGTELRGSFFLQRERAKRTRLPGSGRVPGTNKPYTGQWFWSEREQYVEVDSPRMSSPVSHG